MPHTCKLNGNTRYYWKNLLWLIIMVPLVLSLTNIAGAATPSPIEIYQTMMQRQVPELEQFQVELNTQWMGESVLTAILGWSGGVAMTASASSPIIPGGVTLQAALRPSGFAYIKAGYNEEVLAGLAPYAEWLDLLPAIINRGLLLKLTDIYDIEYAGETVVSGRQAYILNLTFNPDLLIAQLKEIFITVTEAPLVDMALYQQGVYVEEILASWDELALEWKAVLSEEEAVTERIFVDQLDYRMLGIDMSAVQETIQTGLQESYPLAAAQDFQFFQFELADIKADTDGHITEQTWLFHLALPALPQPTEADTEAAGAEYPADLLAFSIDLTLTETLVGGQFLPSKMAADVILDPSMKQYNPTETWVNLPGRQQYNCALELKWDLEKGADSNLLETKKLLNAEKYWNDGLEAFYEEDWKAVVKNLGQLTRIAPSFAEARSLLSDAYAHTDEIMAAISELEQVLMLQPNNLHALNNLAYFYIDDDIDLERGLELAEVAYELADYDPMVVDTLAWAYYKNDMLSEAAMVMPEALFLCEISACSIEELAVYHYHMGAIYAAQKRWAEAAQQLDFALRIDAELADAADLLQEVRLKQVGQSQ